MRVRRDALWWGKDKGGRDTNTDSGPTGLVGDRGKTGLRGEARRGAVGGGVEGSGYSRSRAAISRPEMLLARRPRPLGGRISGEGGDGDRLGERGHGILEICSTAVYRLFLLLVEEVWWVCEVVEVEVEGVRVRGRALRLPPPSPVRKWNLETSVETRLRMDMDMEDWELVEVVEGECLRRGGLGVSLRALRVGRGAARGKAVRMKEGAIIAMVKIHCW